MPKRDNNLQSATRRRAAQGSGNLVPLPLRVSADVKLRLGRVGARRDLELGTIGRILLMDALERAEKEAA